MLLGLALAGVAITGFFAFFLWGQQSPVAQNFGSISALIGIWIAIDLVVHGAARPIPPEGRRTVHLSVGRLDFGALIRRWRPALVLAVAIATVSPCLVDTPLSHDHPVHLFQAWHFWSEMLGRGRLRGWSHFWGFGIPAGELTPIGPDLWVALFRAATLGLLSWTRTYALAFAGMLVFVTMTVYVFTRRFFGASTAAVAALLWLLDPGAWFQGGWSWHTSLGVWPVTLGMGFTLLALASLERLTASSDPRHRLQTVLVGAFWIAASLLTHQLPMIVYPIAVTLLVLDHWRRDGLTAAVLLRVVATCALGAALSAFYIVPMMARSGLTIDLGVQGGSLDELGRKLVEMRVFENLWPPIFMLGLVGAILVARARRPAGVFFISCTALFVILSSNVLVTVFHFERLIGGILKLEAQRLLLVAKFFLFPLAAHAAVTLGRSPGIGAVADVLPAPSRFGRLVGALLIAVLGAPLLRPAVVHIFNTQIAKSFEMATSMPLWHDLQAFFEWSRVERLANKDFYRIAYALPPHEHLATVAPIFDQTFFYKVGYTPAQQLQSFPMSDEPALFEALSVKYMLTDHPINDPSFALVRTFGKLQVYRFTRYRPQPFTMLSGQSQVEVVRFDPEYIQLRLRGTSPGARLRLNVANYPRWEATLAGRRLPIFPAPVYGMEYPILMEVPAGDGDLVFRYVYRAVDWTGLIITLLGLVTATLFASGAVTRSAGWRRQRDVAIARLRRAAPFARPIAAGIGALLLGLVIWRLTGPSRLDRDSVFLFRRAAGALSLAGNHCVATEPAAWRCGPHEVRAGVVSGGYGSHFCMTAPAVGPLVLTTTTKLGQFVAGRYDPGDGAGRIRVSVDGRLLGDMATRGIGQGQQFVQVDTRANAGETGRLEIELTGAALHCFDFHLSR
jgi:hypothetical protein